MPIKFDKLPLVEHYAYEIRFIFTYFLTLFLLCPLLKVSTISIFLFGLKTHAAPQYLAHIPIPLDVYSLHI